MRTTLPPTSRSAKPTGVGAQETTSRLGVVVHPARNIDPPLRALLGWAGNRGVDVVQVPVAGQHREVAEQGDANDCDLIVSIGGDGTTLAAIRAAVTADRPVLGVACGSLGALTTVPASGVLRALDRFSRRDWLPRLLPALEVNREKAASLFALNDIAIIRAAEGQVRVTARVDGVLYCRLAGDGCIVSTSTGSSAYTLAAGGPLLGARGGWVRLYSPAHPRRILPTARSGTELHAGTRRHRWAWRRSGRGRRAGGGHARRSDHDRLPLGGGDARQLR